MLDTSNFKHIDFSAGIRRTGNDSALYMRFLKRFPQDPSFCALKRALQAHDLQQAFLSAHTLKGLSAQLGLLPLSRSAGALCELLRNQNPDAFSAANALLSALETKYRAAVDEILALP